MSKEFLTSQKRLMNFSANTKKSVGALRSNTEITARLQLLEVYWREYSTAYIDEPVEDDAAYYAQEKAYVSAKGELLTMMNVAVQEPQNAPAAAPVQGVRMKPIDVPEFSGEIDDWVNFRDLFKSLVTTNNTLSNIHRLQHLRSACKGKANELIEGIALTDGNFTVAWDALVGRYENERLLVSRLIERLLDLPKMTKECSIELTRLVDGTNQVRRSLTVLGRPTVHWDDWLVVQTTRKLDYATRLAWERSIGATSAMPTFEALNTYLSGVLRSFEAINCMGSSNPARYSNEKRSTTNNQKVVRTHVVEKRDGCLLCQGPHGLYKCERFLAMNVAERRSFIETNRVCYNCIGTTKHISRQCPSKFTCFTCKQRHHSLLHVDAQPMATGAVNSNVCQAPANVADATGMVNSHVCYSPVDTNEVVLPTAWISVTAQNGRKVNLRALIDQGSQASFITESVVQQLSSARQTTNVSVTGIGGTCAGSTYNSVALVVSSCLKSNESINVRALILPKVTSRLPNHIVDRSMWPWLNELALADTRFEQPGQIDMLLGADTFADIMLDGVRRDARSNVIAQQTIFGWVVTGLAMVVPNSTVVTMHVQLDSMLQRFWEQEEVQKPTSMSADDAACEALYDRTTVRGADGRYTLDLPFRQGDRTLGQSLRNATRRLWQMEKRGRQYPVMYEGYRKFMNTYLMLGHMERIPRAEINRQPQCYLPHHAVFKPDSTTTKLRVVFDASAATDNGQGLNSLLLVGPRLQDTLSSILLRWRKYRIAISADIEKMYRQMWVNASHRDYQRIVWRNDEKEEIEHYWLKTVTYGTASAPYMAVKTLQRLAIDEQQRFPIAADVIRNDFYVDDCLSGANTLDDIIQLKQQLLGIMETGGMRLLKWSSNSPELLQSLPADHVECGTEYPIEDDDCIKALGIHWHPAADEFGYKVHVPGEEKETSKRQILSEIAKLFDPLGLVAPVIVTAKILMQQLWLTGLGWDDKLPSEVLAKWDAFQNQLIELESIRVKRWFGFDGNVGNLQLHGFSDASQVAYAACVYARVTLANGDVVITLLSAKSKVAPVKQRSIPQLELNGAVLLAELLKSCRHALKIGHVETCAWTDSTVVLAWLRRPAAVWPTYVGNRVGEIQRTMHETEWGHVPGTQNPADVASRGLMPSEIGKHMLWWTGPTWLRCDRNEWPKQQHLVVDHNLLVEKRVIKCQVAETKSMWSVTERFSSWRTLLRVVAYCRRIRPSNRRTELTLHADELEVARRVVLRLAQQHEYGDVGANIDIMQRSGGMRKLHPIIGIDGLLRVGGRLANAHVSYDEQHPVLLPATNPIAKLLIRDAHERCLHGGPQSTIGTLHQRYWLLKERRYVRAYIHKCITCVKTRPRRQHQLMGNLPGARVQSSRPFLHTAVDYAGPVMSRTSRGRGQKAFKSWIAVFVCMSTKATHLELVSELSTAAFIAAFRRFTARRGHCSDVYCDNGTNFVGADRELRTHFEAAMKENGWMAELGGNGTRFHFSPPGSPHFNGLAEATVKMAKLAMKKTIGETKLTFEEMATFLSQIEAAMNSRPLCAIPSDGNDANVLTPGHFLIGQPMTAVPQPSSAVDGTLTLSNRWKMVQQMASHFWRRWSREYLHQLQQRQKWTSPVDNIRVGDIVLIHDESLTSTKWKLGLVTDTHPGDDGRVRVASVKCGTGTIKRAVVKLSVLPIEREEEHVKNPC